MINRISQDFLDQLLSRVDLVELIGSRLTLRKTGREFSTCCPFHTERTPSFTVSPTKQFYHCFGCGAHGNAIGFLMAYEHFGFMEAVEELARSVGLEVPHNINGMQDKHDDLFALVEQGAHFFRRQLQEHPNRQKAIDYLHNRGLNADVIKSFGLGYAPPAWDSLCKTLLQKWGKPQDLITAGLAVRSDKGELYDRFRDRIIFPIRDRRGRTIAFGARTLGETKPKYLNSPETPFFHKGQELYGFYEVKLSERNIPRFLVVEGYLDVIALAQHGICYAVATLGTATTPEHLERLFRISQDIAFCFDGDRAGRNAAWRALQNALPFMRDGRQISFLFLPEGEDPDTLVRKEGSQAFERRITQALPLSEYLLEHVSGQVDVRSIDGRARLAEQSRPLLEKLPDGLFRDLMIQQLAELTGVTKRSIEKHLKAPVSGSLGRRFLNPTRTPVRLAIALLLNRPDLAQKVDDTERFKSLSVPGLALLLELIEILKNKPHVQSAALLLSRYEGTETGKILDQLAQWKPEYAEDLFEAEFLDILERLKKRHGPEKTLLENAIQKGKLEKLSAEERQLLRNLGREKC
jgi:DNA primase